MTNAPLVVHAGNAVLNVSILPIARGPVFPKSQFELLLLSYLILMLKIYIYTSYVDDLKVKNERLERQLAAISSQNMCVSSFFLFFGLFVVNFSMLTVLSFSSSPATVSDGT